MENFAKYKEITLQLVEEMEKVEAKPTKAGRGRIRKCMNELAKLKVEAKKELVAEDKK